MPETQEIELFQNATIPTRWGVTLNSAHKGFVVEQGDGTWNAFHRNLQLSSFIDNYPDKERAVQAVLDG